MTTAPRDSLGVIVLGMHRSGTSAFSGLLSAAGFNMGSDLFGPQAGVNDRGFFENAGAVAINEDLLDQLGAQWDQPQLLSIGDDFLHGLRIQESLKDFLQEQYGNSTFWGLKDPRCALLAPLWQNALASLGSSVKYVFIVRDPLEVANSLQRRDQFTVEKSLMLWMNYNLCCVRATRGRDTVMTSFESLMREPDAVLAKVSKALDLQQLTRVDTGAFIEKSLYRSSGAPPPEGELSELALQLYTLLKQDGPPDPQLMSSIEDRYSTLQAALDPVLLEHNARVAKSEVHYRRQFYEAYDSWWWKLATPLRYVERRIRRTTSNPAPPKR